MTPLRLTIEGQPRSWKNGKQRTSWGGIRKSNAAAKWQEMATAQLWQQRAALRLKRPLDGPLRIHIDIYQRGTKNDVDGDNVENGVLDVLKGLIIADDDVRTLRGGVSWLPHIDRERPRVEILIQEVAV